MLYKPNNCFDYCWVYPTMKVSIVGGKAGAFLGANLQWLVEVKTIVGCNNCKLKLSGLQLQRRPLLG